MQVGDEKAGELIQRTIETIEMLGQHPSSGRQAQVPDIRELILIKIPFLVPYRLVGDSIQVLRVIHQHTELAGDWKRIRCSQSDPGIQPTPEPISEPINHANRLTL